ncbi:sensor histidine kinase [Brevundimonas aveniformis]|uniref:sensor histidine kinase n=1 Tax=Brevundimonas aveniformis TaxID=370977 RepID=UPI00146FBFE4|nr:HAMP domain-containing sensor histidine kinase [Brevundimonas aveniformis]
MNEVAIPPVSTLPAPANPAAAGWHLLWAVGVASVLIATATPYVATTGYVQAALAFGLTPGLVGLALWRETPAPFGPILACVWCAGAALAVGLSGGLAGPLASWVATPLLAGLIIGGRRARAIAAAGSIVATAVGMAVAMATGPVVQPILAGTAAALLLGSAGWRLLRSQSDLEGELAEEQNLRQRLEAVLRAQPLLSLRLASDGRLLSAFGRGQAGIELSDLTQDGLFGIVQAGGRPGIQAALQSAVVEGAAQVRFTPSRAMDRQFEAMLRRLPDGSLLAVLRDVSDQEAREAALDAARQEAESLHQGKSRFLANMSHELRTPLNAVIGFSDMMRQRMFGPLPERYLEYANLIHEAGGHLLDLINDVLDMSKIEAERFELARERFDARDPISAAMRLIRLQAHDKGVELNGAFPADPVPVEADKRALKQMVLNLLSNAVKFTPRYGSVTLAVRVEGTILEISVSDTGVGLSPADIERIGRPYEQAGATEQRAQGTGLGLSLVRSMAELHGGVLTIESTLGEGSDFTLRLPIIDTSARPTAEVVPFPGTVVADPA